METSNANVRYASIVDIVMLLLLISLIISI